MNETQKSRIEELRRDGIGYASIAESLGLTKDQVSGYCRRHGLAGKRCDAREKRKPRGTACARCGSPIEQTPGRKPRRFCSDECRKDWWNAHPERVRRKAVYEFTCAGCGRPFTAYGNSHRKYCSHACYIADRYGKEEGHGQA